MGGAGLPWAGRGPGPPPGRRLPSPHSAEVHSGAASGDRRWPDFHREPWTLY